MAQLNSADKALSKKRGRRIRKLDRAGRDAIEIAAMVGITEEMVYQHLGRKRGRAIRLDPPEACPWCGALIKMLPPEGWPCRACRVRDGLRLAKRS